MRLHIPMHSKLMIAALLAASPIPAFADSALGAGAASARVDGGDFEGSDTGYKIFLGTYGVPLGGEINFVDFGKLGGDGPNAQAWAPAVVLGVPLGGASLYGKLGMAFAEVKGSTLREESKDSEPYYGVGVRVGAGPGVGLRIEYERYRFDNNDLDLASAGLEFRF